MVEANEIAAPTQEFFMHHQSLTTFKIMQGTFQTSKIILRTGIKSPF